MDCGGQSLSRGLTLCDSGLQPSSLLCPWNILDKNIGMGCHFFLQDLGVYLIVNVQCIYGECFEIIIEGTEMNKKYIILLDGKTVFSFKKYFKMSILLKLMYVLCLVAQSCPTLCDPVDCSPPGSSVSVGAGVY